MIAAAFDYSGIAFMLAALLVTAVVVLVERRDHSIDADELDHHIRRCTLPTLTTRKDTPR